MDTLDSDMCVKILKMCGISVTPVRQLLLNMILQRGYAPFSAKEILDEIKDKKLPISSSAVIVNLKLFSIRRLIRPDTITTHFGAGRPGVKYVLVKK